MDSDTWWRAQSPHASFINPSECVSVADSSLICCCTRWKGFVSDKITLISEISINFSSMCPSSSPHFLINHYRTSLCMDGSLLEASYLPSVLLSDMSTSGIVVRKYNWPEVVQSHLSHTSLLNPSPWPPPHPRVRMVLENSENSWKKVILEVLENS